MYFRFFVFCLVKRIKYYTIYIYLGKKGVKYVSMHIIYYNYIIVYNTYKKLFVT